MFTGRPSDVLHNRRDPPPLALDEVDSRRRVSGLPGQKEEREVELAAVSERAENPYRDRVRAGLLDHVVGALLERVDERRQNCWIADPNEHDRRLRGGPRRIPSPDTSSPHRLAYNPGTGDARAQGVDAVADMDLGGRVREARGAAAPVSHRPPFGAAMRAAP